MKLSYLVCLFCLTGCFLTKDTGKFIVRETTPTGEEKIIEFLPPSEAKESTRMEVFSDGSYSIEFGKQYNTESIKQAFGSFRKWHYLGIGMVVLGVYMAYAKKIPNKASIALILSGIGLGVFAHIVPSVGPVVSTIMVLTIGCAGIYIVYKYINREVQTIST